MKKLLLTAVLTAMAALPVKALDEQVCGIGIGILKDQMLGHTVVVYVVPNSPAARAGIEVGNELKKVDNFSTYNFWSGVAPEVIVEKIKGDAGTQLTLTYLDNNNKKQVKTLTRECLLVPAPKPKVKSKEQIEFEKYWYQVAPIELDGWEPIDPRVEVRLSKMWLNNQFPGYLASKPAYYYWENRKKTFTRGYDTCLTYSAADKNMCLQNLVTREINKTQQEQNLAAQQAIAQQLWRNGAINSINGSQQSLQLQQINYSIQNLKNP